MIFGEATETLMKKQLRMTREIAEERNFDYRTNFS